MEKKGKLIVIDGLPGAGKRTNAKRIVTRLTEEGKLGKLVSFPNYYSDSSALVKRYLKGHFVNMYDDDNLTFVKQMSIFFTMDRVVSMIKKDLSIQLSNIEFMKKEFNIICDRYTTSNMLHMSAYLKDHNSIEEYIDWIEKMEYEELGLPKPDLVIFLNVSKDISLRNLNRKQYFYGEDRERINIHKNIEHVNRVFEIKDKVIDYLGWKVIDCMGDDGEQLPCDIVHELIYNEVKKEMKF